MARKSRHQFERRKREQDRQARSAARRNRRLARAESRGSGDADSDLDGIVAGPQPKEKIDDEEVARVIERAMNPGKAVREEPRSRRRGAASGRLFVGNLDFATDEHELREFFANAGFALTEATLVKDRNTGQPRGFAFVELAEPDAADKAIEALDGELFAGRPLRINPAERR